MGQLKKDLEEVLRKHNMGLFSDDGQWCARSDYYDMLQFAAYPIGTREDWVAKTLEGALK